MPKSDLSPEMFGKLQKAFCRNLGWQEFSESNLTPKKLEQVCSELGITKLRQCVLFLSEEKMSDKAVQAVAREFSINESYFFRDLPFFRTLQERILPALLAKKERRINILSVGCSRGEEPYSIAMLLHRHIPELSQWELDILGTDVNPAALESARQGIYNEWSFRRIPEEYMQRYFTTDGRIYEISPQIKKMVRFRYHNIADLSTLPSSANGYGFDLILLRNVMIYFDMTKAKAVAEALFSKLEPDGWLATTPAEFGAGLFEGIGHKNTADAPLIQKRGQWKVPSVSLPLSAFFPETLAQTVLIADRSDEEQTVSPEKKEIPPSEEVFPDKPNETPDAGFYYEEAGRLLEGGRYEEAKRLLRQSLYLDDALAVAHIALGNLLKKESRGAYRRHIARAKELLSGMKPEAEVPLAGGMTAGDILTLIHPAKEVHHG